MKSQCLCAVMIGATVCGANAVPAAPVAGQAYDQDYSTTHKLLTIRYIVFSATPKAGFNAEAFPGSIQRFSFGAKEALPANPKKFLATLSKAEPRYTYRLHLAGDAVAINNDHYVISDGPRRNDPPRFAIQDLIRVLHWDSPTKLRVQRKGFVMNRSMWGERMQREFDIESSGWDGTMLDEGDPVVLGETKMTSSGGNRQTKTWTTMLTCYLLAKQPKSAH